MELYQNMHENEYIFLLFRNPAPWLANIFFDRDNTAVQSMLSVNQINLNVSISIHMFIIMSA